MKRTMYIITAGSVALTVVFAVLFANTRTGAFYSLAVTFGTVAYHFLMRLGVGFAFDITMKNRADYNSAWFKCRPWEKKLYKFLGVKNRKHRLPTFEPNVFNPKLHTWDEIAQAMCQAELVHETIVILSFVPVAFSAVFGAFWVFLITSVCAAAFDLMFVIIQRYNRPRIIRMTKNKG